MTVTSFTRKLNKTQNCGELFDLADQFTHFKTKNRLNLFHAFLEKAKQLRAYCAVQYAIDIILIQMYDVKLSDIKELLEAVVDYDSEDSFFEYMGNVAEYWTYKKWVQVANYFNHYALNNNGMMIDDIVYFEAKEVEDN